MRFGHLEIIRFFSIFRLLHLILKGGLVGCLNQGSWSGSDQSQDIYCSRQEISLSTFSESKYSKSKWNRALRVAAGRKMKRSVSLVASWNLNVERWAPRNLTMGIT